jgi:hypothetical protein
MKFLIMQKNKPVTKVNKKPRSAKLVPILSDRGCHVVSATSPSDRKIDFLDLEQLLFLPSSSSNCSRGLVDPVPDPFAAQKNLATPGIDPGTPVLVARNSDHQTTDAVPALSLDNVS